MSTWYKQSEPTKNYIATGEPIISNHQRFLFLVSVDSIPFQIILTHSMGYFTFDLFWCMLNGETVVMLFHHVLTVVGLFYYSFKLSRQFFIVYALGLTEITNPFLQIRWFLKHHGMRESLLFKIIEVKLIILFFVIRVVVLSYYLYEAFFNKELDFNVDDLSFISLGVLTGYALSFQMFNYVIHQLKKSQKNKPIKKE